MEENSKENSRENKLLDYSSNTEKKENSSFDKSRGEFAFSVLTYEICKNMKNVNELSTLAQVNRSCNEEVSRELEKRHHFAFHVLPFLSSKELNDPSFHVSKILNIKPHVTFLFPGSSQYLDDVRQETDIELEYDIFKIYQKQLPNNVIVIGVFESLFIQDLIHSLPVVAVNGNVLEKYTPAGTLCLCLPSNDNLKIKQSCIYRSNYPIQSREELLNQMIEELTPESPSMKSTLIIFSLLDQEDFPVTSIISEKFPCEITNLWGFGTSYNIFARVNGKPITGDIEKDKVQHIGLNFYGPSLDSWSTVINISIPSEELQRKLLEFKNEIKPKKHSLGLITAPVTRDDYDGTMCYNDNRELVNIVKNIFSEIAFLGAFPTMSADYYFGMDTDAETGQRSFHLSREIISVIILTYD